MLFTKASQTVIAYTGSVLARQFGDFNGDGRVDLLFSGPRWTTSWVDEAQRFLLFSFDSSGRPTDMSATIPAGVSAVHAREGVAADFNGDGRTDFFSANTGLDVGFAGETNTLLMSSPTGFTVGTVPQLKSYSHSADVGDVDNDGDIDVLVGVFGSLGDARQPAYLLMNDSKGNFTIGAQLEAQLGGRAMVSGKLVDVNGDGRLDLVAGNHGDVANSAGWVILGDGRGGFSNDPARALPAGTFGATLTVDVASFDIDGDGDQDLILAQTRREPFYKGSAIQVLANDGSGRFTDVTKTALLGGNPDGSWIQFINVLDVNGDGFFDLVPTRSHSDHTKTGEGEIYLNDGLGRFTRMGAAELGIEGVLWAPSDINRDGRADIVTFSRDLMTYGSDRAQPDPITMQVYLGNVSTGPKGIDPATQGAAGFNELYYLASNPDVAAAVDRGAVASGLAHYLMTGRSAGLFGFAPGATIRGASGADVVYGREGAETIWLGDGVNFARGMEGNDTIVGGSDFDDIHGNQGDDSAAGGAGEDWVVGGKDNDRLAGDEGHDLVYGNLGNDTLDGGAGNDTVRGGQNNDVLAGGAGNDFLSGDRGDDTISGGAGGDVFYSFSEAGLDRIIDFNRAEGDQVRLEPGTTYTTAQVGADTVITMSGGQVVLVGVSVSSLSGDWITA